MDRSLQPRKALVVALATLAALFVLTSAAPAAGAQLLRISARPHMSLRFSTGHLQARPGRITIIMHNPSNAGMAHGIAISGHGIRRTGAIVGPGGNSSVTVTLRRGTYTFYCPVGGHEQAGMKGTLTVS